MTKVRYIFMSMELYVFTITHRAQYSMFDVSREKLSRDKSMTKGLMDSLDKTNVRWRKLPVKSLLAGNGVLIFGGHTRFSSCVERITHTHACARTCLDLSICTHTNTTASRSICAYARECAKGRTRVSDCGPGVSFYTN